MNKDCIVLAADSATTVWEKIFTTDKVFRIAENQPMGIMSYNYAETSGAPVNLLVNDFRDNFGDKNFSSAKECALSFVKYLGDRRKGARKGFISDKHISEHIAYMVDEVWRDVQKHVNERFNSQFAGFLRQGLDDARAKDIINRLIEREIDLKLKNVGNFERNKRFNNLVSEIKNVTMSSFILDEPVLFYFSIGEYVLRLSEIVATQIVTGNSDVYTGLVFAGYGQNECYPSFTHLKVFGIFKSGVEIGDVETVYIDEYTSSWVETLAQDDVAKSFIDGVTPELREIFVSSVEYAIVRSTDAMLQLTGRADLQPIADERNKKIKMEFVRELDEAINEKYEFPIKDAIRSMSRIEMAELAESLIKITSLRRHVSFDLETVGGPVDVAVISKHEGFIWVHRKHYFNMENNPFYRGGFKNDR